MNYHFLLYVRQTMLMTLKVCSAFPSLTKQSIAPFSIAHWDMPHSTAMAMSVKVSETFQHRINHHQFSKSSPKQILSNCLILAFSLFLNELCFPFAHVPFPQTQHSHVPKITLNMAKDKYDNLTCINMLLTYSVTCCKRTCLRKVIFYSNIYTFIGKFRLP